MQPNAGCIVTALVRHVYPVLWPILAAGKNSDFLTSLPSTNSGPQVIMLMDVVWVGTVLHILRDAPGEWCNHLLGCHPLGDFWNRLRTAIRPTMSLVKARRRPDLHLFFIHLRSSSACVAACRC